MKLRNKKTGEIGHLISKNWNETALIIMDKDGVQLAKYHSLAELNAEWRDAPEEPKEYWFIYENGTTGHINWNDSEQDNYRKEIGNYFETKEEAELAVRKLKAWKRLKDKRFEFAGWGCENQKLYAKIQFNKKVWAIETEPDLDLVFGGEE